MFKLRSNLDSVTSKTLFLPSNLLEFDYVDVHEQILLPLQMWNLMLHLLALFVTSQDKIYEAA